MKTTFRLLRIENEHEVTADRDYHFLLIFRQALIHELKNMGTVDEMQCRELERALLQRFKA